MELTLPSVKGYPRFLMPSNVFASGGGLLGAEGEIFGPDGNLYVNSFFTNQVLRYNGTTGAFIDVFASGGGLSFPNQLVFGPDGNLYVAAEGSGVMRYNGTTGAFIDNFVPQGTGGLQRAVGLIFTPFTFTSDVGGSVTGISPKKGTVICWNLTTHKAVRILLDGSRAWNCEDAGLKVRPGDQIKILLGLKGTAQ